jgi:hypothetical protein
MVVGLVVGVLSIPALVFGANSLFAGPAEAPIDVVQPEAIASTTVPPTTTMDAPTPTAETPVVSAADLKRACGEDGLGLVAAEADGSISPLEQAALDALRPICETEGLALPQPLAPEPVVIVETVLTPAPPATVAGDDAAFSDNDDDGAEDRDHDEDDEDHEDDD